MPDLDLQATLPHATKDEIAILREVMKESLEEAIIIKKRKPRGWHPSQPDGKLRHHD